jgi:hypothetical protein
LKDAAQRLNRQTYSKVLLVPDFLFLGSFIFV